MTEAVTQTSEGSMEKKKPRLVLMGEFSAGKSTLTNILLDKTPLPMRVTATRLPPVELTYGDPCAYAIAFDGSTSQVPLDAISDVPFDETLMIKIQMQSDVLELCDLVDMPGISDPNMRQDIWESIIEPEDNIIWCTHATQAWRQSEAAVWTQLSQRVENESLLLITQFDKLQNERDKRRVVKRVEMETEGLFDAVYPVCLLDALNAEDDAGAWEASGAAAVSEHVIQLLMKNEPPLHRIIGDSEPVTQNDLRDTSALREHAHQANLARLNKSPVIPRRVSSASGGGRHPRSMRQEAKLKHG